MSVSGDIKENYTELHRTTGESYASIARRVASHGDHSLAAWLREQAGDAGEDTTPYEADFAGGETVRGSDDQPPVTSDPGDAAPVADGKAAAPAEDDQYAVLTDDELGKLAKDNKLDAGGSREEIIARLAAAAK